MREIKFRAWNAYAKTMYEVDLLHLRNSKPQQPTMLEGNYMSLVYQPKTVLMQSTSLKDKNGVEIYEGDVVTVSYPGSKATTAPIDMSEPYKYASVITEVKRWIDGKQAELEVIGNIYENPELLTNSAS